MVGAVLLYSYIAYISVICTLSMYNIRTQYSDEEYTL